jgi:hypothetical protein
MSEMKDSIRSQVFAATDYLMILNSGFEHLCRFWQPESDFLLENTDV